MREDETDETEMCPLPSAYCSRRKTVSSETTNFLSCTMWGTERGMMFVFVRPQSLLFLKPCNKKKRKKKMRGESLKGTYALIQITSI